MPNLINSSITAGVAKAIQAGLNMAIATHTISQTGSGSLSISMIKLPPGAKVINVWETHDNTGWGTGAETVCVKDSLGNTYIQTAALSTAYHAYNPTYYSASNIRLTASANLQISFQALVGTGSGSLNITVGCMYTAEHEGD